MALPNVMDTMKAINIARIQVDMALQGPSWPRILGRSDFSLQENKGEVTVR